MAKIHFRLVTPERRMYDGDVDMVIVRTTEGDAAFMAGHIPYTTTLGYGMLHIINDGARREATLIAGFAEVADDVVTVLSDSAEWPEEIDINRARRAKERAERAIHDATSGIEHRLAELALRRANVRIEAGSLTEQH